MLSQDLNHKLKVIFANGVARAVVYGLPIIPIAFLAPGLLLTTVPFLALGASQPWFNEGVAWLHDQAYKRWPKVVGWIDNKVGSMMNKAGWWKNGFALVISGAVAIIQPAHVPSFIIQAAVPVLMLSGMPMATNFITKWLEKLPWVGDLLAEPNAASKARLAARRAVAQLHVEQKQTQAAGPATPASVSPPQVHITRGVITRVVKIASQVIEDVAKSLQTRHVKVIGRKLVRRSQVTTKTPEKSDKTLG